MNTAAIAAAVRFAVLAALARFDAPLDATRAAREGLALDLLAALLPGVSAGRLAAVVYAHASTRAGFRGAYNADVPPCVVARYALARRLDVALAMIGVEPSNDVAHADGAAGCVDCGVTAPTGLCDACDRDRAIERRDAVRGA